MLQVYTTNETLIDLSNNTKTTNMHISRNKKYKIYIPIDMTNLFYPDSTDSKLLQNPNKIRNKTKDKKLKKTKDR